MERVSSIGGGVILAAGSYLPSMQDITTTLILGVVGGVGGWLAHSAIKLIFKKKRKVK